VFVFRAQKLLSAFRSTPTYDVYFNSLRNQGQAQQYESLLCLIGNSTYAQRLQRDSFEDLLQMYRMSSSKLERALQNPVCDAKILVDTLKQAYETVKDLFAATDHVSFCR